VQTHPTHKEVRKIQVTGKSTYILSLPKKWIKEMHIGAGDQVTLVHEADSNSLSMIAGSGRATVTGLEGATITISPKEGPETLKRKVVSTYLAGYSTIRLKIVSGRINPSLREGIRELVRRSLIGTEIIADSSDEITLQVLLSVPELSVSTALRRMYLIAHAMHKDAMLAVAELNSELANEVVKSDDEVDRFSLYISRSLVLALNNDQILREIGLHAPSDCLSYRIAVKSIERIGDHAAAIAEKCQDLQKLPSDFLAKTSKMSELALSVFNDSVESLLQGDYELADRTVDRSRMIRQLEEDAITYGVKRKDIPHFDIIRLVLEDIRRTAEYASDIAETAINETINEVIGNRRPHAESASKETA
jgi:phosphate uptake regulator